MSETIAFEKRIASNLDDSTKIARATVALATAHVGDQLVVNALGLPTGITVDPTSTTTHIVLQGSATAADYQIALQQISVHNNGETPDPVGRMVDVTVSDDLTGTDLAAATIAVEPSAVANSLIIMPQTAETTSSHPPTNVALLSSQPSEHNIARVAAGRLKATERDPDDPHTLSAGDPRFNMVDHQPDFGWQAKIGLGVTATDLAGQSVTPPLGISLASVTQVRFAAFGDYGLHTASGRVADLVDSLNVDFVITVGDNIYGSAPIDDQIGQYYSDYIGNYKGHYGPGSATNHFYPALGNHEYSDPAGGTNASAYLKYFTLPGNERYYDFRIGPIHFFAINSDPHEPNGRTSTSAQAKWLQAGLKASTSPYDIVYFHHSPFSSGAKHGSIPEMRWPFEQWGATAVLSGHDHIYERVLRDDNGDGTIMPYFIVGLGGAVRQGIDSSPVSGSAARYNANWGTLLVNATSSSMTFEFRSITGGGKLIDRYTVHPSPGGGDRPLFTAGDDVVDFNGIDASSYFAGSQYNAMAGNDRVALPLDAPAASAGSPFHGGDGNDVLTGGTLDETIYGDRGADALSGRDGNDRLFGGAGDDTLIGGRGDDSIDGASGTDKIDFSAAAAAVVVDLSVGIAKGDGTDTLVNLEHVSGSAFNDRITGNSGTNLLLGGAGNDLLHGAAGDDTLIGNAGVDRLNGDAGNDILKWSGADSFDGGRGFDTIDAKLAGADHIDLRGAQFVGVERIQTGGGEDRITLSLNDVLSDTADNQFVADLGSGSLDTLNIDLAGGWTARTSSPTLGPTGQAADISVAGLTAYTFTHGADMVTVFSNAEVVNAEILS